MSGGAEFIVAAYVLTAIVLAGYLVSLRVRSR
jgi:hypothetical protein